MLASLIHKLGCTVRIEVKGSGKERFINMAAKSGLAFWDLQRNEDSYSLNIKASDYGRFRALRRRCKVQLRHTKKTGLGFKVLALLRRPGMVAGFAAGILLVHFLGGRAWVLTASGSEIYSEKEILEAAERAGVYYSCKFDDFDPVVTAHRIMLELDKTSWVSVNTNGVFVDVAVHDSKEKPPITDQDTVKNIVASEMGVIKGIEAEDGMPVVEIGDAVMKGDLCISGIWKDDKENIHMGASRGRVMAEVFKRFTVVQPMYVKHNISEDSFEKKELYVFNLKIPLSMSVAEEGEYEVNSSTEPLYIMGVKMPVGINKKVYRKVEYGKMQISQEEAVKRAEYKMDKILEDYLQGGEKILSQSTEVVKGKDSVTMSADCRLLINIAEEQKIMFE